MQVSVKKSKGKYEIDVGGNAPAKARIDPYSSSAVKKLATKVGVSEADVIQWIVNCDNGATTFSHETNGHAHQEERFSLLARNVTETNADAIEVAGTDPLSVLREGFGKGKELLSWKGSGRLCCLDVDYHGIPIDRLHNIEFLHKLVDAVHPSPALAWPTKGMGLHLIYESKAGFGADEYAALAAMSLKEIDPVATFELKTSTRIPPNVVWEYAQSCDAESALRYISRHAAPERVQEYLESAGFVAGRCYDHNCCPIQSHVSSHGNPVLVGEQGVFCHKCESLGVCFGSRKPGFFPYAKLIHGGVSNVVGDMVRGFVHFTHAHVVLAEKTGLSEHINELAYKTLLKLVHGPDDPRIPSAFIVGKNLVRVNNTWETKKREGYSREISGILKTLPAVRYVDAKGDVKVDESRLTAFKETIDLSNFGYVNLHPIVGCRIYSHFQELEGKYGYVVESLKNPMPPEFKPKYRKYTSVELTRAWQTVERILPGIIHNVLLLDIAAIGVRESRIGLAPIIVHTGPTSTGKSFYPKLAASLCGNYSTSITFSGNLERLRQSVAEGARWGSSVVVNEIFKNAAKERISNVHAMDFTLNLDSDSVSHKLYVGPVSLDLCPVIHLTDIYLPLDVSCDRQQGRRAIHAALVRTVEWEKSLVDNGIFDPAKFRQSNSEVAEACNIILSYVIDTFFRLPLTIKEIAGQLGFTTILESAGRYESDNILRQFYAEVCSAREANDTLRTRVNGDGWRHVQKGKGDKLEECWNALCDNEFNAWTESRRCKEVEWRKVLGVEPDVTFDLVKYNAQNILVRFT